MSLLLRGNTYHLCLPNPKGGKPIRESCRTTDKKLAQKVHDLRQAQLWEGRFVSKTDTCTMTFEQAFDRTMREVWQHLKAPETPRYNYERLTGKAGRRVYLAADTPLVEITRPVLKAVIEDMKDEYPNSTINRSMAVVSKIFNEATKNWELPIAAPAVPLLEEKGGRLRWLQEGEEVPMQRFFEARGDQDMSDLIEVLLGSGCRLSEVLNLQAGDVDLKKATLHLRDTKNGEWAYQPMSDSALRVCARRYKIGIPLFHGLTRHAAIHRFQNMKKHLGYENDTELCLHTMRHTAASRLILAGLDLKRVQMFLRHKDINTTLRYAKISSEENLKTAAVLNKKTV